jgi:PIN domain nuclease of toxin-antitoxin system
LRFLLDTHIWLWFVIEPHRLKSNTLQTLKDPQNDLWLSPISTWEALALHRKGRVFLHGDLTDWVTHATAGLKEAVLTHDIARAALDLPLHKDPADRMIAATALFLDLTLITADVRLIELRKIKTLANR